MNTKIISWSAGSLLALATLFYSYQSVAHSFKIGEISIAHPYASPSANGAKNGAAYFENIKNNGKQTDFLVSASSPASNTVELHIMSMDGDVMRMREVKEIEVAAGAEVKMQPGKGYHLMLIGLKNPLKEGDKVPVKLKFKIAGEIEVIANVEKPKSSAHDHHKH